MAKADVILLVNHARKAYENGLLTWFEYREKVWSVLIESKITDGDFIKTIIEKTEV